MRHERFAPPAATLHPWLAQMFSARAVRKGGLIRRSVASVDRECGRAALLAEVRRRRFHLIECGDQFLVICNPGQARVIC